MTIRRISAIATLRKLRQAKAAEGFDEQEAFEFIAEALMDSNKRIQQLRDWKDSLAVVPVTDEDEEAALPSDDEGKEEFASFVEEYIGKAKECREFLLSALWDLWGLGEKDLPVEVEEEALEDLEEEGLEDEG